MALNKTDIYFYADLVGMQEPKLIGVLAAQQAKGKKAFSFEYDALKNICNNIYCLFLIKILKSFQLPL